MPETVRPPGGGPTARRAAGRRRLLALLPATWLLGACVAPLSLEGPAVAELPAPVPDWIATRLTEADDGRSVGLAPELLQRLSQHAWPGNLRQYANVLRTAGAMLDPHEHDISWHHLPDDLAEDLAAAEGFVTSRCAPLATAPELSHNLQALSRAAIDQALQSSHGNMSQAAKMLGISRQTLYRKLT